MFGCCFTRLFRSTFVLCRVPRTAPTEHLFCAARPNSSASAHQPPTVTPRPSRILKRIVILAARPIPLAVPAIFGCKNLGTLLKRLNLKVLARGREICYTDLWMGEASVNNREVRQHHCVLDERRLLHRLRSGCPRTRARHTLIASLHPSNLVREESHG